MVSFRSLARNCTAEPSLQCCLVSLGLQPSVPRRLRQAAAACHLLEDTGASQAQAGGRELPLSWFSGSVRLLLPLLLEWLPVRSTRDTWRSGLSRRGIIFPYDIET